MVVYHLSTAAAAAATVEANFGHIPHVLMLVHMPTYLKPPKKICVGNLFYY